MATTGPLVVVFDDIHWAETAFLDLVEYLASFVQEVPLLLLCTARPDLFETRPTWTAPRPNAIVLTLDPLSEEDSETLVERLGDLPEETRERIVDAAEGNPLFVEQLVAMRAEGGDGELEVPPTLQALLAARIDRLGEPERAVVERGSVEGRLFHRGAVGAAGRARATRGRHAPADARSQGADPARSGDAAGGRRLPLRPHPHPRRGVRGDPETPAGQAARALRRLARLEAR
jgi:predicted ATPase